MDSRSLPRWLAPVIGAGLPLLAPLNPALSKLLASFSSETGLSQTMAVALMAVLGGLAGSVILFTEPKRGTGGEPGQEASVIGRSVGIVQILVCYLPILGLVVSTVALIVNWKTTGWLKVLVWIGFSIAVVISLLTILLLGLALVAGRSQ